ncbi:MAG: AmmeMemoRadiSam system radical SAM enzyme [Chloroflexota bacterium]
MHEAMLYQKLDDGAVRCDLCAHRCKIRPGQTGICAVRENRDGTLYTLVYGQSISAAVDPIEKKPLYHFYPGATALSIATVGCNFSCQFCQNADISQLSKEGGKGWQRQARNLSPETIVTLATSYGCATIAYTYTEPTIFFEYASDTARLASQQGIKNILVTNGYMTPEMLEAIGSDLHAANVDLKAFTDRFYRQVCGGRLQPVLDNIATMHAMGVWIEVTTLLIPGENDAEAELRDLAAWLAALDPDIPWHISRFHPDYKMRDHPPTPVSSIHHAVEIGYQAGLRYVYAGNVPGDPYDHTRCPACGAVAIERFGYRIRNKLVNGNHCPACGEALAVVGT